MYILPRFSKNCRADGTFSNQVETPAYGCGYDVICPLYLNVFQMAARTLVRCLLVHGSYPTNGRLFHEKNNPIFIQSTTKYQDESPRDLTNI